MRTPFNREEIQKSENEFESTGTTTVAQYERCSFCSSKLIFSHDLNLSFFEVVETGRCPGCGVALNPKKFKLH